MITGGCLCGAVTFDAPPPALFCAHCHCAWCRRAHGAAFVTWLGVQEKGFALRSGEPELRWYASSEQSERGFCTRCGTTMLFRSRLAPGEVHVALGCVDDPGAYPPRLHVFWEAHVPWGVLGDDLPKASRDAEGLSRYRVIAERPPRSR